MKKIKRVKAIRPFKNLGGGKIIANASTMLRLNGIEKFDIQWCWVGSSTNFVVSIKEYKDFYRVKQLINKWKNSLNTKTFWNFVMEDSSLTDKQKFERSKKFQNMRCYQYQKNGTK